MSIRPGEESDRPVNRAAAVVAVPALRVSDAVRQVVDLKGILTAVAVGGAVGVDVAVATAGRESEVRAAASSR